MGDNFGPDAVTPLYKGQLQRNPAIEDCLATKDFFFKFLTWNKFSTSVCHHQCMAQNDIYAKMLSLCINIKSKSLKLNLLPI